MLRKALRGVRPDVMLYLARAYYDADRLPDARATLIRALHLAPGDHKLHFNIGVTMQARARMRPHACMLSAPFPSHAFTHACMLCASFSSPAVALLRQTHACRALCNWRH